MNDRAQDISPVGDDPASARGLTSAAYTEPAYLELERRALLDPEWIPAALEDDVAQPGRVFPTIVAGQPLLVVRDRAGRLRVFHNVCRHRGTCLVTRAASRASLVCPYHGWTYALDGTLERAPNFDGDGAPDSSTLDHSENGLVPVRFGIWNRVVFVNLGGAAPGLEQRMAPLSARWQHVDFSLIRHGQGAQYEVDANWKLVTENFLESYHLPTVHRSLNSYSALAHHNVVAESDSHFGQQSTHYLPGDAAAARLPRFPGLTEAQAKTAEYLCVFPTTWLSVTADHFRVSFVEPLSPGRTRIRWEFYFVGDEALSPEHEPVRQTLVDRVLSVFEEDVEILERLQLGRTSRGFDGGCFSPRHERAVHRFQRLVAASYLD